MSTSVQTRASHWPLTLLSGVGSLLNLILPLFLVRLLPPEQVGHYKIFFLYLVLVPWMGLTAGVPNGLAYWAGQRNAERYLKASWTILILQSVFIVFVLFILSRTSSLFEWIHFGEWTTSLFLWGLSMTLLGNFFEEASIAQGKVLRGALIQAGFEVTRNISLLVSAFIFRDVRWVFVAYGTVTTLKVLLTVSLGYRLQIQRFYFDSEILKAVARYAFPVSISAVFLIGIQYFDQLYLSKQVGPASFALYTFGCLVIPPLLIFEQAVNKVLIPQLSRALSKEDFREAHLLYRNAASELAWLLYPAAAGLMLFSEGIVTLLFTEKYIEAASFLRIYAVSHILSSIPYDALWRAQGKGKLILKHIGVFSILSIVGVLTGFSIHGMAGALVGFLLSAGAMRLTAFLRSTYAIDAAPSRWLPGRDLIRYVTVIFGLSIGVIFVRLFFVEEWSSVSFFLVFGSLFGVSYIALTFGLFLRRRSQLLSRSRVLMLTQYLGLGGLERMILNLSIELAKQGKYEPFVYVYENVSTGPTLHHDFKKSNITVHSDLKGQGLSLRTAFRIARYLVRNRILILHSHDLGALIYGVLAKVLSLGAVKIVHTQHSFVHLERSPKYKWYEQFFSKFADQLVTVSEPLRLQYETVGISPQTVQVIPNGIPFDFYAEGQDRKELIESEESAGSSEREKLKERLDDAWVLCMARIHPRKGQDHVLKLWAKYEAHSSKGTLIIMGAETSQGELERILKLRDQLKYPERVVYAGFTLNPQAWLRSADIWISGSEFEGMPLAPIEALLAGCNILVSDISGHASLPQDVPRFSLKTPEAGAHILNQLLSKTRTPLSEKSIVQLRSEYGASKMAEQYQQIYDAL